MILMSGILCSLQAKGSASRLELERSMMERQRDEARAVADEYAAQLAEFDAELEVHMTEALQERAKSAAISRKGSSEWPQDELGKICQEAVSQY